MIEDDPSVIDMAKLRFGEDSTHEINLKVFTNYKDIVDYLDDQENINNIDLVICDHYFPSFSGERPSPIGTEVFYELFCERYENIFVHFSSCPCPEDYDLETLKENLKMEFISLNKQKYESWSELDKIISKIK